MYECGGSVFMLGAINGDTLTLFRRGVGGVAELLQIVRGDNAVLCRALATAHSLEEEALAVGGWLEANRLSLDPQKPGEPGHVEPVVLALNGADRSLGELKVTRRTNGPGPVRVGVSDRLLALVPASHSAHR